MNSLGIYFGEKIISLVETRGKKLINNINLPQTTISAGELEEKVPNEVKLIEIIALLKDELRRNRVEVKEAAITLSGKELIIRTFEMPEMPRNELVSAVNFEVKKYIPFKIEDLVSDFQIKTDKVNQRNLVLFMGIKKETLDKYLAILNQLNIKANKLEYSAFSMLRFLRLGKAKDKGIIGLINADFKEEFEANFTVLEDGFPLFSRDLNFLGGPETSAKGEMVPEAIDLEKIKTEIRLSLDYYHRKFSSKQIKKLFLILDPEYRSDLEAFLADMGVSVQFIDIAKCIGRSDSYHLSFAKAYACSIAKSVKINLQANLLTAREKAKIIKEKVVKATDPLSLLYDFRIDFRIVMAGVLVCLGVFAYGLYRIQPFKTDLSEILDKRVKVSAINNPDATYDELVNIDNGYKNKLIALDSLIRKQLYFTEALGSVPESIPEGVWLKRFSLNKKEEGKAELNLEGMTYLGDNSKEFEAVYKFVSNLKENQKFRKYFKEISIISLNSAELDQLTVSNFSISCRNY